MNVTTSPTLEERALGAYLGFAVGDALGATLEFMTPSEIRATYGTLRQIVGGGWLQLRPGQVTDDTQLCLALGEALLVAPPWDLTAVADSFAAWMQRRPVDIGHTCRRGIRRYLHEGTLTAPPSLDSGGNGAAMRNLPVVLATLGDPIAFTAWSLDQAHFTHHHPQSDAATLALGSITQRLIHGATRSEARALAGELVEAHPEFRFAPWPGRTSGFIVDTVQTVFAAFFAGGTFEECVVDAVNRGGDADTIGALTGQLAGAHFGVRAIPPAWLRRLDPAVHEQIRQQTPALLAAARRFASPLALAAS